MVIVTVETSFLSYAIEIPDINVTNVVRHEAMSPIVSLMRT